MATKPGILTEWPWQKLGSFKYLVLAPFVARTVHSAVLAGFQWSLLDYGNLAIIPFMLSRMLHNQVWISLSRYQTARGGVSRRIVDKGIDFEQVDRERNWDDQIILNAILFYLANMYLDGAKHIAIWRTDGVVLSFLLHAGPVEFLYYWLHRALHHHFLYSRYHSHHHSSIVTEPITSVIHPFAEHLSYFFLFSIPTLATVFTRTASIAALFIYITYIDFMNNMGHCNFELVPRWAFRVIPPIKYLMYTPTFHSLHHTQFRTNYSLFMPFYDYIYGTMDRATDELYEASLKGKENTLDVVHITHPTTLSSLYYNRLGFAALASKPYRYRWYMTMLWPLTCALSMLMTWTMGSAFTIERNRLKKLEMQTWMIPRYKYQFSLSWEKEAINGLIINAIKKADAKGVKVVTLGLLNQDEELNRNGDLFVQKYPDLNLRVVDGSSLAAAIVLHSIPHGTQTVLLRGSPSKLASALAFAMCNRKIQVVMVNKAEYHAVKESLPVKMDSYLKLSSSYSPKVWLVGDGVEDREQATATKGTHFIPFSQFPPKKLHKGCVYYSTPAMKVPKDLENMHSCENWLPRRVMSAWRIAGIVHALEGWDTHECGDMMLDMEKVWAAAIHHGFVPLANA